MPGCNISTQRHLKMQKTLSEKQNEKIVTKLKAMVVDLQKKLFNSELKYKRLAHENRELKNEVEALKHMLQRK